MVSAGVREPARVSRLQCAPARRDGRADALKRRQLGRKAEGRQDPVTPALRRLCARLAPRVEIGYEDLLELLCPAICALVYPHPASLSREGTRPSVGGRVRTDTREGIDPLHPPLP